MTFLKCWAILAAVCCSPTPLAQAPTAADARNRPGAGEEKSARRILRAADPGPARRTECESHFARLDANSDGSVTEQEFSRLAHVHDDLHAAFVDRDRNHDGKLTKEELCPPARLAANG